MITEILDEIRIAEAEAEEITKKAAEDAKQTVLHADEESRKIRLTTVKAVKEERRKVAETAAKEGGVQYAKIVASGKTAADKLVKETSVDKAAEFIKEKVLTAYVDC